MIVSLLLTTYNGEKYIEEQLESIRKQTRQPDRVLILDDRSTDKTVDIVELFIDKYHLENWQIRVNEINKGWKKNFWDGLKDIDGDIVFLCDQDDIWDLKKIEIMVDTMIINPQIKLLACGFEGLYEDGNKQKISRTIEKTMRETGQLKKFRFDPSFTYVLRPGCTYAIKLDLWKIANEFWHEEVPHDAILWRLAALTDELYLLDSKLIQWRRFNTNSSNPYRLEGKYSNKYMMMYYNILENVIKSDVICFERLLRFAENNQNVFGKSRLEIIKKSYMYQKKLEKSFENKSILQMLYIGVAYNKYFYSIKTYIKYLLLVTSAKLFE